MITHSVPERKEMVYFYYCKATEEEVKKQNKLKLKSKLTRSWACLK